MPDNVKVVADTDDLVRMVRAAFDIGRQGTNTEHSAVGMVAEFIYFNYWPIVEPLDNTNVFKIVEKEDK